jgi:hypothetical protein
MFRRFRKIKPFFPFIFLLILPASLEAAESGFQSVFSGQEIGVRATGMGCAFVAVADDGSASYWNPAGLAFTKKRFVELASSGIQATGFARYGYILYSQPDTGRGAGAISWAYTNIDFDPGLWLESSLSYSCAFKRDANSAFGLTVKYMRVDSSLEIGSGEEARKVGAWGIGLDLGVLVRLGELSFGIMARDIYSMLKWSGGSKERIPSSISAGMAIIPIEGLLVSAQIDGNTAIGIGRAAAGIEIGFLPIPIRGGLYWRNGAINALGITGGSEVGFRRWGARWRAQMGLDMNTALEEGALKVSLGAEF